MKKHALTFDHNLHPIIINKYGSHKIKPESQNKDTKSAFAY